MTRNCASIKLALRFLEISTCKLDEAKRSLLTRSQCGIHTETTTGNGQQRCKQPRMHEELSKCCYKRKFEKKKISRVFHVFSITMWSIKILIFDLYDTLLLECVFSTNIVKDITFKWNNEPTMECRLSYKFFFLIQVRIVYSGKYLKYAFPL